MTLYPVIFQRGNVVCLLVFWLSVHNTCNVWEFLLEAPRSLSGVPASLCSNSDRALANL